MMTRRHLLVGALLVLAAGRLAPPSPGAFPDSLTDQQFWTLSQEFSEPGGTFRSSENLLSNERLMQHVIPALTREIRPGSAYLGVGPEQNFTYIAALKPSVAFIVDIRRGNLQLHLMYKALFELSRDRLDFVSRLFSRARPDLPPEASVDEIFVAIAAAEGTDLRLAENAAAVRRHLTRTRKLPLPDSDLEAIQAIHQTFYAHGPLIQYSANFGRNGMFPTYAELMTATDAEGVPRSFLASEAPFAYLRTLHMRNLIVPVVGDFAGDKALRALGEYLREKQTLVGAFYLSNVEQYLGREGRWHLFCQNVGALPLDDRSRFIRSIRDGSYGRGIGLNSVTGNMLAEARACER